MPRLDPLELSTATHGLSLKYAPVGSAKTSVGVCQVAPPSRERET